MSRGAPRGRGTSNVDLDWESPAPQRPARATREKPAASPRRGGGKTGEVRIRVSNIPRNLDRRDIQEAFEDCGRVVSCELNRGTAFVTFKNGTDAKKAAQTFDRGELNGQTILVTID